jgi:hypothetical protein
VLLFLAVCCKIWWQDVGIEVWIIVNGVGVESAQFSCVHNFFHACVHMNG